MAKEILMERLNDAKELGQSAINSSVMGTGAIRQMRILSEHLLYVN